MASSILLSDQLYAQVSAYKYKIQNKNIVISYPTSHSSWKDKKQGAYCRNRVREEIYKSNALLDKVNQAECLHVKVSENQQLKISDAYIEAEKKLIIPFNVVNEYVEYPNLDEIIDYVEKGSFSTEQKTDQVEEIQTQNPGPAEISTTELDVTYTSKKYANVTIFYPQSYSAWRDKLQGAYCRNELVKTINKSSSYKKHIKKAKCLLVEDPKLYPIDKTVDQDGVVNIPFTVKNNYVAFEQLKTRLDYAVQKLISPSSAFTSPVTTDSSAGSVPKKDTKDKKVAVEENKDKKDLTDFDRLIEESFVTDESCSKVFTGNAGNYATAGLPYARTFAYSMLQDLCSEDVPGSILNIFQQPSMNSKDVLSLSEFNKGSSTSKSLDNLATTYAISYSLGQRESNGNFSEGRDLSATNTSALTEEAGLVQVSANSLNLEGTQTDSVYFLRHVFQYFIKSLANTTKADKVHLCLADKLIDDTESKIFDTEGDSLHKLFESEECKDVENNVSDLHFSVSNKVSGCFRRLNKECPSFAIKYGAAVSRINRKHNGPLILHKEFKKGTKKKFFKPYLVPSCHELFQGIAKLDLAKECAKPDSSK